MRILRIDNRSYHSQTNNHRSSPSIQRPLSMFCPLIMLLNRPSEHSHNLCYYSRDYQVRKNIRALLKLQMHLHTIRCIIAILTTIDQSITKSRPIISQKRSLFASQILEGNGTSPLLLKWSTLSRTQYSPFLRMHEGLSIIWRGWSLCIVLWQRHIDDFWAANYISSTYPPFFVSSSPPS